MVRFFIKGSAMATAAAVFVLVVSQLQMGAFAAEQPEFDYFVLSLRWPDISCRDTSHGSVGKHGDRFTIHGLWPEYNDGTWPSCCTDEKFDQNKIDPLNKVLSEVWPTYPCDFPRSCNYIPTSFWGAQYEKHGTCAAPIIKSQYDYFSKAINLYDQYSVNEALEDFGISPSMSQRYAIEEVLLAIKQIFNNRTPKVKCGEDAIIKEIWLCFDKDFKPRDCDFSESCPAFVRLLPTDMSFGSRKGMGAIPRIAEVTEAVN